METHCDRHRRSPRLPLPQPPCLRPRYQPHRSRIRMFRPYKPLHPLLRSPMLRSDRLSHHPPPCRKNSEQSLTRPQPRCESQAQALFVHRVIRGDHPFPPRLVLGLQPYHAVEYRRDQAWVELSSLHFRGLVRYIRSAALSARCRNSRSVFIRYDRSSRLQRPHPLVRPQEAQRSVTIPLLVASPQR